MKIIGVVFLAWFLAQLFKMIVFFYKSRKWEWAMLLENGGMPSAHASSVAALSFAVLAEEGFSRLFVVCIVFSLIVLNDTLKVRWQAGVQAGLLNELLGKKSRKTRLSQSLGHRPSEVAVGILLGLVLVGLFYGI